MIGLPYGDAIGIDFGIELCERGQECRESLLSLRRDGLQLSPRAASIRSCSSAAFCAAQTVIASHEGASPAWRSGFGGTCLMTLTRKASSSSHRDSFFLGELVGGAVALAELVCRLLLLVADALEFGLEVLDRLYFGIDLGGRRFALRLLLERLDVLDEGRVVRLDAGQFRPCPCVRRGSLVEFRVHLAYRTNPMVDFGLRRRSLGPAVPELLLKLGHVSLHVSAAAPLRRSGSIEHWRTGCPLVRRCCVPTWPLRSAHRPPSESSVLRFRGLLLDVVDLSRQRCLRLFRGCRGCRGLVMNASAASARRSLAEARLISASCIPSGRLRRG